MFLFDSSLVIFSRKRYIIVQNAREGISMIIKEFNKPLYWEKYYYRELKMIVENHSFGIFSWYESEYREGHVYTSRWHGAYYTIYFVVSGIYEDTDNDGNRISHGPGSIVLYNDTPGYTARSVGGVCIRKCIHLYKTEFTRKLLSCFFPECYVSLHHPEPEKAEELFDRIKEEYCRQSCENNSFLLLGLVTQLLENIRQHIPTHTRSSRFDEILGCVESNLNNPVLNRDFLCRQCGTSVSTLDRLFRKHTFSSVNEYIRNKRLELVTNLLSVTTLRMNEIASAAGFSGTNHMNWVFRKKFGLSPSQYRKNILLSYLPLINTELEEK